MAVIGDELRKFVGRPFASPDVARTCAAARQAGWWWDDKCTAAGALTVSILAMFLVVRLTALRTIAAVGRLHRFVLNCDKTASENIRE